MNLTQRRLVGTPLLGSQKGFSDYFIALRGKRYSSPLSGGFGHPIFIRTRHTVQARRDLHGNILTSGVPQTCACAGYASNETYITVMVCTVRPDLRGSSSRSMGDFRKTRKTYGSEQRQLWLSPPSHILQVTDQRRQYFRIFAGVPPVRSEKDGVVELGHCGSCILSPKGRLSRVERFGPHGTRDVTVESGYHRHLDRHSTSHHRAR